MIFREQYSICIASWGSGDEFSGVKLHDMYRIGVAEVRGQGLHDRTGVVGGKD